jgi:hypothetical protein
VVQLKSEKLAMTSWPVAAAAQADATATFRKKESMVVSKATVKNVRNSTVEPQTPQKALAMLLERAGS